MNSHTTLVTDLELNWMGHGKKKERKELYYKKVKKK